MSRQNKINNKNHRCRMGVRVCYKTHSPVLSLSLCICVCIACALLGFSTEHSSVFYASHKQQV